MSSMRYLQAVISVISIIFAIGFQTAQAAEVENQTIVDLPYSFDIIMKPGSSAVIYGQRNAKCGGPAPLFSWLMKRAREIITKKPKNGMLSDGGIGKRFSQRCKSTQHVRAVSYIPNPGFTGTDAVRFWQDDPITITVTNNTMFQTKEVENQVVVDIPNSFEIVMKLGSSAVIYGQRNATCGGPAPMFLPIMGSAVIRWPSNGILSDGGVGKRSSRRCGGTQDVRAVSYTPNPGFTGTDTVRFGRRDLVTITVKPK